MARTINQIENDMAAIDPNDSDAGRKRQILTDEWAAAQDAKIKEDIGAKNDMERTTDRNTEIVDLLVTEVIKLKFKINDLIETIKEDKGRSNDGP